MAGKAHIKTFPFPIYGGVLVILLATELKQLDQYITGYKITDLYAHTINADYKSYDGYFIILNPEHAKGRITHGTVAHESFHASNMLLENRGVIPSFENDEAQAYLLGWITERVYQVLNKRKIKLAIDVR